MRQIGEQSSKNLSVICSGSTI